MQTMNANELVGRMTAGRGWLGPEWFGCCGTGTRPKLSCPKVAGKKFEWILVGPEMELDGVMGNSPISSRISSEDMAWLLSDKSGKHPTKRVWKFKGRQGAINRFQKLIDDVLAFNNRERELAKAARTASLEDKIDHMINR